MLQAIAAIAILIWNAIAPLTSQATADQRIPMHCSGVVVDGLGRPITGVTVTATLERRGKLSETTVLTDDAGHYVLRIALPPGEPSLSDRFEITFAKKGFRESTHELPADCVRNVSLTRLVRWLDEFDLLYKEGVALDVGVREILAADDYSDDVSRHSRDRFFFEHQVKLRPVLRRFVDDPHVGPAARNWLALLGDPADDDLFPDKRPYAPKDALREADLVAALQAAARERNFFSALPEPQIDIDVIVLSKTLDRALVECGINRVAMTGITWRFVFHRIGNQWVLRSAQEAGRS